VTFNGATYDLPMIMLALKGKGPAELKHASNLIIKEHIKPWEIEKQLEIVIPKTINHVDLSGSTPSVRTGLKVLGARLHGKTLLSLPFDEDARLTRQQMNVTTAYCFNDLDDTHRLFDALREPLSLRQTLTKRYGVDMRSKSDAQVGEAIIKKRIERLTNSRI
jgi:hypothetical protein